MAKQTSLGTSWTPEINKKGTSIGRKNVKLSSMNKAKKRSYKKYRGQG